VLSRPVPMLPNARCMPAESSSALIHRKQS
jgi:hypothetical protein